MTLLTLFELLVLAGWSSIVLYGFVVSLIGWSTKRREAPLIYPRHIFALIVPVENDEAIIGKTIEHLRRLKYPRDMFEVVIAPVNSTDQTTTVARRKGAIVYGPGNKNWRNRDDAILASLERLSSKNRFDGFIILDAMARLSANYLNVLSDKLSKGALVIQSGYQISGARWSLKTGLRAILAALSPSWLTGWSVKFRLGGGGRRIGFCLSRRIIDKYKIRNPAVTDLDGYTFRLLRENVDVTFAAKAKIYDWNPSLPPVQSLAGRWQTTWHQIRHHALPMIKEGIEWKSMAQVLGGVNAFLPSFTGVLSIGMFFFVLAAYLHGLSSSISIGWMVLNAILSLFVLLRMIQMQSPVIAYATIPMLPFVLWWRALYSCFIKPEKVVDPIDPPAEAFVHNKRKSRRRRSPRRHTRRQQSS